MHISQDRTVCVDNRIYLAPTGVILERIMILVQYVCVCVCVQVYACS